MHVSFWALVAQPENQRLQTRINELAQAFTLTAFSPHITLGSRDVASPEEAQSILASLHCPSFRLRVGGLITGDSFYQRLYFGIEEHPSLTELRRRVLLGAIESKGHYQPHLSLAYAAHQLQPPAELDLGVAEILVNSLAVVCTEGTVAQWRLLGRHALVDTD